MPDRLKIYLETSVISYLVARPSADPEKAAMAACTRRFMDEYASDCDIFVSDIVENEARKGDDEAVARRLVEIARHPFLKYNAVEAGVLARRLREQHRVFDKEVEDALHIAACAVAGVGFLLTWNCRHMANPVEIQKTIRIVTQCGYTCPTIITPRDYIAHVEDDYADDPIVREVHEARYEIMAEHNWDVSALLADLAAHPVPGARYVSPKPFTYAEAAL